MPDVWSHILLGDAMRKEAEPELQALLLQQPNLYAFGCQGPDFFFYHTFLRQWNQKVNGIGRRLHREKPAQMLLCGIDKVRSAIAREKPWRTLAVYLLGAISHWAVDSAIHPLVYAIVSESGALAKSRHKRIEAALDMLLLDQYLVKQTVRSERLALPQGLPLEVVEYYTNCLATVWPNLPTLTEAEVKEAYRQFIQFLDLSETKNGYYKATQAVAALTGGQVRLDWFWYPPVMEPDDVIPLNRSLPLVLPKALQRGILAQKAAWHYWQSGVGRRYVLEALPDIPYGNRNISL